MPITLAQAKVGMADKVDQFVVDEFRRSSLLLDLLEFDNIISPTGGSTLTYGYIKLLTPSLAAIRALNNEYSPGEAIRQELTTKAVIMGGKFQLDRVIIETSGAIDELQFQLAEKVKAVANYFTYLAINGDSTTNPNQFDGLAKLLTGSSTVVTSTVDVSTAANLDANYNALLDDIDAMTMKLAERPSVYLMNNKTLVKVRAAARRAGYFRSARDEFGRNVEYYNDVPMMGVDTYYNGSANVEIVADGTIYAICIRRDGFIGISPEGNRIVRTYLPDLDRPGAVKDGEVELVCGVALKNTLMAGAVTGITIV